MMKGRNLHSQPALVLRLKTTPLCLGLVLLQEARRAGRQLGMPRFLVCSLITKGTQRARPHH